MAAAVQRQLHYVDDAGRTAGLPLPTQSQMVQAVDEYLDRMAKMKPTGR
jgi:hypothetical protein